MEIGYVNTWSQVVDSSIILHVEYVITDPSWYIIDAHLAVATYLSDIPKTKTGNPIPGLFPYQASGIWSQYYEFTVNLTELFELYCPVETTLYIAAHAVVARVDDYGVVVRTETAWGQGSRFTNRGNWGMYYTYTVNCETSCEEVCTLDGNSSTAWARGYDLGGNSWATYNVYTGGNQTTDLMWRQYTYVGDIYIWKSGSEIIVRFNMAPEYSLTKIHIHVATSKNGIPHTSNWNPRIGNFEYQETFTDITRSFDAHIPLDSSEQASSELYLSIHTEVDTYTCIVR